MVNRQLFDIKGKIMKFTKSTLAFTLAAASLITAGCSSKGGGQAWTPADDGRQNANPVTIGENPAKSPYESGLDLFANRQPLARKIFANAGYVIVKYADDTRVRVLGLGYIEDRAEYTDCYFLTKAKDDGHLYNGCAITNAKTETVKTDKTFSDLGTRVATLQP
jgi:hypothetical protein